MIFMVYGVDEIKGVSTFFGKNQLRLANGTLRFGQQQRMHLRNNRQAQITQPMVMDH